LHQDRLWERGFDHAVLLAGAVAGGLQIPLAAGVLQRERATAPQAGLGARARWANVGGAFRVDSVRQHLLEDRRVVLVDDILTSGATASACAEALQAAGAAEVRVATLARAILGGLPRSGAAAAG
jgi:predicted amidophosphoribosyltransferase